MSNYLLYSLHTAKVLGTGANVRERKGRGTMFDSLLRLRYSRPFHFGAYNEGPTWGGCVLSIPGEPNATSGRKAVFRLFPLFYSTRVAYAGYVGFGLAVWEWSPCCLAPLTSESAGT